MLEAGRRPHLVLKALHPAGSRRPRKREDLERHAPAERDLPRFVDDAHSAAGDLPHDAKVSQSAVELTGRCRSTKTEDRRAVQRFEPVDFLTERTACGTHRQGGQFPHGGKKSILRLVERFERGLARRAFCTCPSSAA